MFKSKGVITIFIINLIVFVLTLGGLLFVNLLGNYYGYTFYNKQFYRLVTCMFVHSGFSHFICNSISLFQYGFLVENMYGTKKFLLLYILCGIGASAGSALIYMIFGMEIISVGASGAICGLLGIILSNIKGNNKNKLLNIIFGILPLLLIGFTPGIDNVAHFVGFGIGFILGKGRKEEYSY